MIVLGRWLARLLGLALVVFFIVMAIGEKSGAAPWLRFQGVCLLIALAGLLLGWKWEGLGGGMALGGIIGFYADNYSRTQQVPSGVIFPLMYVPAILFLICWSRSRGQAGEGGTPSESSGGPPRDKGAQHE